MTLFFPQCLIKMLQDRNISHRQLGAMTEVGHATVSRIVRGERVPTEAFLEKAATALQLEDATKNAFIEAGLLSGCPTLIQDRYRAFQKKRN